jgi:hypothetical protein
MEPENLNIKEVMESRRHAVEESLRVITVDEMKALTDELSHTPITRGWKRF